MDALSRAIYPHRRKTSEAVVGSEAVRGRLREGEEEIWGGRGRGGEFKRRKREAGFGGGRRGKLLFRKTVIYLVYLGRGKREKLLKFETIFI